jgi:hypothetical protein
VLEIWRAPLGDVDGAADRQATRIPYLLTPADIYA